MDALLHEDEEPRVREPIATLLLQDLIPMMQDAIRYRYLKGRGVVSDALVDNAMGIERGDGLPTIGDEAEMELSKWMKP
jgi:hypothetical protein